MNGVIFKENFEKPQDDGTIFCVANDCPHSVGCMYKTNPAPHTVANLKHSKTCPMHDTALDSEE